MGFANVFGNAAREQELSSHIKKVCSSVRNAFRQEVRSFAITLSSKDLTAIYQISDSIDSKKCSLSAFTYRSATKFRRGQYEDSMGFGFTIHNAILVSKLISYMNECVLTMMPYNSAALARITLT